MSLAIDSNRLHALRGLEVDHRPHVQAADRRVRVDAGDRVVLANDREEPLDVVAQLLRRDRGVLDERQRLGVALHRHRQAERGFAEAPDPRLIGGGHRSPPRAAAAGRGEVALERVEARRQLLGAIAVELDAEQRPGVARAGCCAAARRAPRSPWRDRG